MLEGNKTPIFHNFIFKEKILGCDFLYFLVKFRKMLNLIEKNYFNFNDYHIGKTKSIYVDRDHIGKEHRIQLSNHF